MKVIIAGAGIGGLTTALFLHKRGIACEVYDQVTEIRELGVGITLMPHAVRQLVELDLLAALDTIAIRSRHLYFTTKRGQIVWDEPRGLLAGHDAPQFFAHRGMLQAMLYAADRERLPEGTIRLGCRLDAFTETADGISARFIDRDGQVVAQTQGDVLIGADGIHSMVRQVLQPGEGPPLWSGLMLWRGATDWPVFGDGASNMIAGGVDAKFVAYPIAPGSSPQTRLTNWAAVARIADFGATPPRREDWSRIGRMEDLAPLLKRFDVSMVDIDGLVAATDMFWEYPMCDRDPIAHWSRGRVTLLGDAAHPMYPMGGNGAAQAILDARCLTDALVDETDPVVALQAYEQDRLPGTSEIVRLNRVGGPEAVIDAVEALAPDGFGEGAVDSVLSRTERERYIRGYASKASTMSARAPAGAAAR